VRQGGRSPPQASDRRLADYEASSYPGAGTAFRGYNSANLDIGEYRLAAYLSW
jgi:hypothetical protein